MHGSEFFVLHADSPLPGYPIGSLPAHVPSRLGFIDRLYLARRKAAAATLVTLVSAAAVGAAGFGAWKVQVPMDDGRSPVVAPETSKAEQPSPVATEGADEIEEAAERAVVRVTAVAGAGSGEEKLAKRRQEAAAALARSGDGREAMSVVRSIEGIADEVEARQANASPLQAAVAAVEKPTAAPDASKLEAAFSSVEDKVTALESFLAERPAVTAPDDRSVALEVRVVGGEGQPSAFWRRSESGEQQHFAIVEAVTQDGSAYPWEVTDMDTGSASRRKRWAVQVTEAEYARIAAEKAIGHTLPDPVAGTKPAGSTEIEWRIGVVGGALGEWEAGSR